MRIIRISAIITAILFTVATCDNDTGTISRNDFNYETDGNAITITKYTGTGGSVTIPAQIDGRPVIRIGQPLSFFRLKN
jgi:hypothetical protein